MKRMANKISNRTKMYLGVFPFFAKFFAVTAVFVAISGKVFAGT